MIDPAALINQVAFPIVMTLLLYRMATTTIKENTQAINDLKNALPQVCRAR